MGRAQVCRVRDCESLEDAPGQSLDDTSDEEHLETGREKGDKDGSRHDDHADDHGLLVADPFGDVTVDDQTEDTTDLLLVSTSHSKPQAPSACREDWCTNLRTIQDNGLPPRRNESSALGVGLIAEPVPEWLEGKELVHQGSVVAFHDHSERDDEGEHNSFPPEPQALADRHVVFVVDSSIGAIGYAVAHRRRLDSLCHMANGLVIDSGHGKDERRIGREHCSGQRFGDISSGGYTDRRWIETKNGKRVSLYVCMLRSVVVQFEESSLGTLVMIVAAQ